MPKPDAGPRRAGMNMLKGGKRTAQQTVCVLLFVRVFPLAATGSSRRRTELGL